MTTGDKIKQLRLDHKMSQTELAKKCGYNGATIISKYEKGERRIPYAVVVTISNIFGVTPNYLMGFTEKSINDAKLISMGFTEENLSKLDGTDLLKLEAYLQALLDSKK